MQLFDSWAGALSLRDYREYVLPHSARVLAGLADAGVPRIHFGVGTGELLGAMARGRRGRRRGRLAGAAGTTPPDGPAATSPCRATWTRRCCSPVRRRSRTEARRIVAEGRAAPGHVFNLGHGVLPGTDPDVLTRLVELVHGLEP